MSKVSFMATNDEYMLAEKAVDRAADFLSTDEKLPDDWRLERQMDLIACHANGCPLDLKKLAEFDTFNLMHDVIGIMNHIDRKNGSLSDHFLPRSHV